MWILAISTFIISLLTGFISIPLILKFCKRRHLYDIPNERKVHKSAIPRLGGISFLPSMMISSLIVLFLFEQISGMNEISVNLWTAIFLFCLFIIYFIGLIDDLIGLSAVSKFVFQIIAATLLPISNLYINDLYGFCGIHEIPFWIGCPITIFVIVFIVNAMNLIDGIDGLSGSLSLIAFAGFMYAFISISVWSYVILIAGLMGVIISFLYFNIFGKPERGMKIFMGDAGSLSLGFMIAFLFVKYSMSRPDRIFYDDTRLFFSYTLLIIPMFDVIRVMLVRLREHRSIFSPDKNHIHHKILALTNSQHKTLGIILLLQIGYIIFNFAFLDITGQTLLVFIDIFMYILFNIFIDRMLKEKSTLTQKKQQNH